MLESDYFLSFPFFKSNYKTLRRPSVCSDHGFKVVVLPQTHSELVSQTVEAAPKEDSRNRQGGEDVEETQVWF